MKARTAISYLDHNGQCIGCGAAGGPDLKFSGQPGDEPCAPDCGFETGEITAPVVLRYACTLLLRHPMGIGYDAAAAIFDAAQVLTHELSPYPLHTEADKAICAYLSQKHGPDCGLSGPELLYRMGLFVPLAEIAMALYDAAAGLSGLDFGPEDFGDFR